MNRNNRTILVVDDDPALVTALAARLGASGYVCTGAASGSQAIAQFQQVAIDLVVSDLDMPNGDGASLAEAIRRVSDVPIVLVSGHKENFSRRLRSVRDVSFLRKPFSVSELMGVIGASFVSTAEVPPAQSGLVQHD